MDFNTENTVSRRDLIRRGGIIAASVAVAGALDVNPALGSVSASPRRGGNLRIGVPGGPAGSDILDPHAEGVAGFGQAFRQNVYSKLTDMMPDGTFENQLAESMRPNPKATVWKIKLKQGIKFHDGSELTADDVIYTFNRILNPSNVLKQARGNIDMIDPKGIVKDGKYDLTVNLLKPWSDFRAAVGQRYISIIKDGAKGPWTVANANGTGAFKLESWTPGTSYKYVANKNYFETGKPYVASVTVIGISDSVARVNALLSKQVDAISDAPVNQVPMIRSAGAKIIVNPGGSWTPLVMNTNVAPYNDVRVRQAMKLLIDRDKAVKIALAGYGTVGNDLFAKYDALYAADIPQRTFDPKKARELLKAAGHLNTNFVLSTSEAESDFVPLALVFEQGAKEAGIKITIKKDPADTFWDNTWGVAPFTFSSWGYRGFFTQWNQSFVSYNKEETQWINPKAVKASALVAKAAATGNFENSKALAVAAQQLLWDDGGYIIPYFKKKLDAAQPNVKGIEPHVFPALSWYRFWNFWLE